MSKSRKRPQDRKPKATAVVEPSSDGFVYTFVHNGAEYPLPHPGSGAEKVATGVVRNAMLRPDDVAAQMALGFAVLECSGVDEATITALYEKPMAESTAILSAWMRSAGEQLPPS